MNRNYKFPKFLPPIPPLDAKSHYPLPYTVVNDKIEDTRGDSYFHFFSARSGGRAEEEKKKMVYPNLESQRPINAPREKLSTRIMQIILETPEGSRASHFVSPSARTFLPPGSSLVTSSLYLATLRSSLPPLPSRSLALALLLISYSLRARFNRSHESPTSRPKRVNPFTLMRVEMREIYFESGTCACSRGYWLLLDVVF